jgi:hypothetical protein
MPAIDALVQASQELHRAYRSLFGTHPVGGQALTTAGDTIIRAGDDSLTVTAAVNRSRFSPFVTGGYTRTVGPAGKDVQLVGHGFKLGGGGTDDDAQNTAQGGATEEQITAAEAAEIAAVPDPSSPEGQAAIIGIIQKYQAQSRQNIEATNAANQAAGDRAAGTDNGDDGEGRHHHHRRDDDDYDDDDRDHGDDLLRGSGGGLLSEVLNSLLGGGAGSPMTGDPFGTYGQNPAGLTSQTGPDPFAPISGTTAGGGAPATTAGYNPASDPFAMPATNPAAVNPTPGDGTVPVAGPTHQPGDPSQTAGIPATGGGAPAGRTGPATPAQPDDDWDMAEFPGADGSVPVDPATAPAASPGGGA